MASHDIDPVLQQLVRAINESGQATVPATISVHGVMLTGALIAERRYAGGLVEGHPLMITLEPSSGLPGKEYTWETETESDHHLHILTSPAPDGLVGAGLWRISLEAVDGWTLGAEAAARGRDGRGPFRARSATSDSRSLVI